MQTFSIFANNRYRDFKSAIKTKQNEVDKFNGKILDKIVEVNKRKVSSLGHKINAGTHKSMSNLKKSMQSIDS